MDPILARKIEQDKDYRSRIVLKAKNYLKIGRDALAFWSNDFDTAYDLLMCYAPLGKKDMELLERGHPKRFVWPMTATQISTMTTYVAQVLFGQETPWHVEGRRSEDEIPAEFVNQLLRWNAEQQATYLLGYLWVQDCLAVNRGIFYNSWSPIFKTQIVPEQVQDPNDIDPATGQGRIFSRPRRKQIVSGGYNRMEIVSPYDFITDPTLPLWRQQEMRFNGHRFVIPVTELRRRSKLPPEHPLYVLPSSVAELVEKAKKGVAQADAAVPSLPGVLPTPTETRVSRTAYERTRALQPTGNQQADKADTGNVEVWELWVKLVPSENGIYDDEPYNATQANIQDEPVIFQILIAAGDVLLSINESTYEHNMFPYSVGEGRPNAHFQFAPSWVMILKGIQDYIDWLKNRHQEALSRTIGNVFVVDPSLVDVTDFMNPEKEGLLITLKPEAYGRKIDEIIKQVPIKDMTENFHSEAMEFMSYADTVTASSQAMQGSLNTESDISATQFSGTMQMGAGRLTSIARLLSSQALVPQARQFVANFQQFMDMPQTVRFQSSKMLNLPPELQNAGSLTLSKDVIQGEYDFIAHDGTLPGPDARKVAAITRLLESAAVFPQVFEPAPGNLDPRLLIYEGAKASGVRVEDFAYDASQFQTPPPGPGGPPPGPGGPPPDPNAPPGPGGPPAPTLPPVALNSAPQVQPPGATPGPKPAGLSLPGLSLPGLGRVGAPQPKPTNS